MKKEEKPLVWLKRAVKMPPFSKSARIETGVLLGLLQAGELIGLPQSRPMPSIGKRCHELRINDEDVTWRVIYRIDADAILILDVFKKKDRKTPKQVIKNCKARITEYDEEST